VRLSLSCGDGGCAGSGGEIQRWQTRVGMKAREKG
jgi:hypothetical protein